MLKILPWIVSVDFRLFQSAINILERQHDGVEFVGMTSELEGSLSLNGKNVPFIPLAEVDWRDCDVLLVVGAIQIGMSKVTKMAQKFNLPEEKLLGDWIVCIPGFTLEKYRRLQHARLSIFSKDCFGGLISHTLGLTFYSPLVNMFFDEKEYIRFLRAPRVYMEENLIYQGQKLHVTKTVEFPVAMLGNIDLNMLHYETFEEAVAAWNKRKARINWYNLFVAMWTESEEILEQFNMLPYGKKVCFVPFKSDLDSAWYINPEIKKGEPFWRIVHLFAYGDPFYYDVFDMLLYGKKTQLIDM